MSEIIRKLLYTIGIALTCGGLYAQSLDQAKKMYEDGLYEEAKPVFERLVERTPNNTSYNHWYGVCCLETGEIEKAEKHLGVAVKGRVQESYRYMGNLYFRTYRFEQAIEMYSEYISLLTKKKQDVQPFEAKLDLAKKGQRMVERVENIQVIDSIVVDKNDFFSTYKLSEDIGSLTSYEDFFRTNGPIFSSVFMNQKGDRIYYADKGEDDHYYLYTQSKLIADWSDEKQLPFNVNSEGHENNYPFILTDGATIYYASTGHGSLGGYDIFVTRYNTNQDSYLTPEQLGMPYNSIYNDYMLVIDEDKELGWFVSDRFQPEDKVCVYLFIPDQARGRLESEDIEQKIARAEMRSIQDTWVDNADYSDLIQLAYTENTGPVKSQKDFDFVINDKLVYYTLEDIKSPEAKNFYQRVIALNKQIEELNQALERERLAYSKANQASRQQLSATILRHENQLEELLSQPEELEKHARNAEIIFLRNAK